jgi:molybdate transport system substrate-binding protein
MSRLRVAGSAVALGIIVGACAPAAGTSPSIGSSPASSPVASSHRFSPGARAELMVYGAASLTAVLDTVAPAFEAAFPRATVTIATDSSAALETQIEQGAPADVFLSADTTNPQKLVDKGLAAGGLVPFATNTLTVIVPSANPAGIRTPADLARPGLRIIAAGDAVPISTYATQLVGNLASQPGYPADFAASYAANVASKEDNVKAVVAKVELGEGDAGIVYATDARASTKVATIAVPDAANVPATDAGVVVRASHNTLAAQAFLDWLAGPDGQAILAGFGFLPPG